MTAGRRQSATAAHRTMGSPMCRRSTHLYKLSQANELVRCTANLLRAARDAGSKYVLENPDDRGHLTSPLYLHASHGPLWRMPAEIDLCKRNSCAVVTFPQCALGASVQKYTTFRCTPGLQSFLAGLADLTWKLVSLPRATRQWSTTIGGVVFCCSCRPPT
eukprot:6197156-Pleurochrysis_carterae.AAC.5